MVKQTRAGGPGVGVGTTSDEAMDALQAVPLRLRGLDEAGRETVEPLEIPSSKTGFGKTETDDTRSASLDPSIAPSKGKSRRSKTSAAIGGVRVAGAKIAGGKNRVVQIRRPRDKEWTEKTQKAFLDQLALTGNVTTSVAVVNMSVGGAYNRRAHDPAFAAGWQAALLRGYERLEELLLATTLAALDRSGLEGGGVEGGGGEEEGIEDGGDDQANQDRQGDQDRREDGASGDAGRGPAGRKVRDAAEAVAANKGQAVPGAGLIQLSSVTAIQFALSMLNQHRADQVRGRNRNQIHRATSADTDAALTKLLDSLARRRARES